jgi:DNA-binding response OmpR family regulator
MPDATVLVVEDDPAIRRGLVDALRFAGYRTLEAADGRTGLDAAMSPHVDLVLLDILMPGLDGIEVLRRIRRNGRTVPVIFLTARGQEEDRVLGLRAGADDYVVKPFSATEVLARVEAVLRRSAERPPPLRQLRLPALTIDFERREIERQGRRSILPDLEARVLEFLAANRGRAVSREELLRCVWGVDPRGVQSRAVDMAVARLREHLGDDPLNPRVILTVRKKGYMLATLEHQDPSGTPQPPHGDDPR